MWADILWNNLRRDRPEWIGTPNPYNQQIIKQFGNGSTYFEGDFTKPDADPEAVNEHIEL